MKKLTIIIAFILVAGASATPTPFIGALLGQVHTIPFFQQTGDWMKTMFNKAFSQFSEIFATQISSIHETGNSISQEFANIADFFEKNVKSALESVSTAFGLIYITVPKLITDSTATIKAQVNDFNSKIKDTTESSYEKINDLALGLLEKFGQTTAAVARIEECSKTFLEATLPEFANAILPEMGSCVESSATNINATDLAVNAFGIFKNELSNVNTIVTTIVNRVVNCMLQLIIGSPDTHAHDSNEAVICLDAVVTYLDQKIHDFFGNIMNAGVNVASRLNSATKQASDCMTTPITKATTMVVSLGAGIDSCLSKP